MATTERSTRVERELLVVRLWALQEAKTQLMYAHRSYLQRSFMILRDFKQTGEASTHLGLSSEQSGHR
jgi:hypothetical protein